MLLSSSLPLENILPQRITPPLSNPQKTKITKEPITLHTLKTWTFTFILLEAVGTVNTLAIRVDPDVFMTVKLGGSRRAGAEVVGLARGGEGHLCRGRGTVGMGMGDIAFVCWKTVSTNGACRREGGRDG